MLLLACLAFAVPLLLTASASDVALRVVPNWVCLALGLDGLVLHAASHHLPASLLTMLAVLVPASLCWRHGIMGGGDVKLVAATVLLVPPQMVPVLLLAIAVAGGLLGLGYWTMMQLSGNAASSGSDRVLRRVIDVERHRIRRGFSLPYAVAICCGAFYVLGKSLLS